MIIKSCFEVFVTNVFPYQEYYIYADKSLYGKYIVCVGRRSDPHFKSVLLHFDDAEDLLTFLLSIDVPHNIMLDPNKKGILAFDKNFFADILEDFENA